jgi:hypothetical protein
LDNPSGLPTRPTASSVTVLAKTPAWNGGEAFSVKKGRS